MLRHIGILGIMLALLATAVFAISAARTIDGDTVGITIDYGGNQGGIITEKLAGAKAVAISDSGQFNSETGEIKWIFLDDSVTTLTYTFEGDGEVSGTFTSGEQEQAEIQGAAQLGDGLPALKENYDMRLQVKTLYESFSVNEKVELTDPPSIFSRIVSFFRNLFGLATGVVQTATPEQDQSKIANDDTAIEVLLLLRVEEYIESTDSWEEAATVVKDAEPRRIRSGQQLKLDQLWNDAGGWTPTKAGTYRIYAEARNTIGATIKDSNSLPLNTTYTFTVTEKRAETPLTDLPLPPSTPGSSGESGTQEEGSGAGGQEATECDATKPCPDGKACEQGICAEEQMPDVPTPFFEPEEEIGIEAPSPPISDEGETMDEEVPMPPTAPGQEETTPQEELPTPPSAQEQEKKPTTALPPASEEEEQPIPSEELPSPPEAPGQEQQQGEEEELPTPPATPGSSATDTISDEDEQEMPVPPATPGQADFPAEELPLPPPTPGGESECSATTPCPSGKVCQQGRCKVTEPEEGLPQPPPTPGQEEQQPPQGCCLITEGNEKICVASTQERCQNGAFKTGGCEDSYGCNRVFLCAAGEARPCTAFGFTGEQTCTTYHQYGACIVKDEAFVRTFDNDLDGDPDATDCAPTNDQMAHTWPEVCDDKIDNNCNYMVDEDGCEAFAEAEQKGLVGFAFRGTVRKAYAWRSAAVLVSIVMGIALLASGIKEWKRRH